ncbi:MAG: cytochrome c-type biogenesis protein CcmH [Bdellovibrionales bacterium]|nr:cytochrome c-type biogenesis protein CcmH [Bdellovibrionales bacterium]
MVAEAPLELNDQQLDIFQSLESSLLSPFCPGRLLRDCPSSAAAELKYDLKLKIQSGATEEDLRKELFEKFGSDIRAAPEAKGIGLLAWYAPLAFLLVGFLIIYRRSRNRARTSMAPLSPQQTKSSNLSEGMLQRIEDELNAS